MELKRFAISIARMIMIFLSNSTFEFFISCVVLGWSLKMAHMVMGSGKK
jgi:hypothetical protein